MPPHNAALDHYQIETAALRAWPAEEEYDEQGWRLRFAGGYTKRANSVTPLSTESTNLEERVVHCEQQYSLRGLVPIFRLLSFIEPPSLDELLATRGYTYRDETLVLVRNLTDLMPATVPATLEDWPLDDWLEWHARWDATTPVQREAYRAIVASITQPHLHATLLQNGTPVACALGIYDTNVVGIFGLVVAPEQRGKGYGKALTLALLQTARQRGATCAYLQVLAHNQTARNLYTSLGFTELYRYWYRVSPIIGT